MSRHRLWVIPAIAILLPGCGTGPQVRRPEGPTLVHRVPSEKEFDRRVAELTRAGHPLEQAQDKARREFEREAWNYDHTAEWAAEKARAERSAAREQIEKELARLDGK